MIAGIMEWDMKPRAQSVIPPDSKITILENTTFCHRRALLVQSPKGVPPRIRPMSSSILMKFMWTPEQQVLTWRGVHRTRRQGRHARVRRRKNIQDEVKEFWRPEYDQIGAKWKVVPPPWREGR